MRRLILFLVVVLLSINFIYAEEFGYNLLEPGEDLSPGTNESALNVNKSDFWDDLDFPNATQMENSGGQLNILESWLTTFINSFSFITTDTNASTECSNGYYLDGDATCYHFNDSVKRLFAEEQVVYNASVIVTQNGTLDSGNLNSITQLNDGDTYNVSEHSGEEPLRIIINFTNVVNFNTVALRGRYEGSSGHTIDFELYRVGVGWEEREEITDQISMGVTTFDVFIGSNFIDTLGTVQLRINHDDNGIPSHDYFLDAAFIGQVAGLVSGGDLGDLTGRDNACTLLPTMLCANGTRALTGNWNYGAFDINGSGDILTTGNGKVEDMDITGTITIGGTEINAFIGQITTKAGMDFKNVAITVGSIGANGNNFAIENNVNGADINILPTNGFVNLGDNGKAITFTATTLNSLQLNTAGAKTEVLDFDFATGNDYRILDRTGGLAWTGMTAGQNMVFEQFTNDGDGSNSNTHNIFAEGTTSSTNPASLLQIGYNIGDNSSFRFWSIAVGAGTARNITLFTEGNTNQLLLGTGGEVFMVQAVNDALGNLRDTKWDSATGQIGYDSSSRRYKENITNLPDEISNKVFELNALQYDKIDGAKNRIGLTAEQTAEYFPQCVSYKTKEIWGICEDEIVGKYDCVTHYEFDLNKTTGDKIPESINYDCLITPAIQEVQNLNNRLKYLEENCVMK